MKRLDKNIELNRFLDDLMSRLECDNCGELPAPIIVQTLNGSYPLKRYLRDHLQMKILNRDDRINNIVNILLENSDEYQNIQAIKKLSGGGFMEAAGYKVLGCKKFNLYIEKKYD